MWNFFCRGDTIQSITSVLGLCSISDDPASSCGLNVVCIPKFPIPDLAWPTPRTVDQFSKCVPQPGPPRSPGKLFKNADFQVSPQTYWIRKSGSRALQSVLTSTPGTPDSPIQVSIFKVLLGNLIGSSDRSPIFTSSLALPSPFRSFHSILTLENGTTVSQWGNIPDRKKLMKREESQCVLKEQRDV